MLLPKSKNKEKKSDASRALWKFQLEFVNGDNKKRIRVVGVEGNDVM